MRRSVWGKPVRFPRFAAIVITLAAVAVITLAVNWLRPAPSPLSGRAEAVDGDTLRIGPTRIRLTGLDAPELDQTCSTSAGEWNCGGEARAFLAALVDHRMTNCAPSGRDCYGRTLARCDVAADDLGAQIVAAGWAVIDFDYGPEQAASRAARRGIWAGDFISPAEWRRTRGAGEPGLWEWLRSWLQ